MILAGTPYQMFTIDDKTLHRGTGGFNVIQIIKKEAEHSN